MCELWSNVYPPSEDTYLLLEASRDEVRFSDRVLEVGTGSGVIASDMSDRAEYVVATDINPHALKEARRRGVKVIRTNLYDGVRGEFDLVLFNPPYLPSEERDTWMEFAVGGGESGRSVVNEFISGVDRVLSSDGTVLVVVSSFTGIEDVAETAEKKGFVVEKAAGDRYFFEEFVVLRLMPL